VIRLFPAPDHVRAVLRLTDHRDLSAAVSRIRRLLDLDADPVAVDEVLNRQPVLRPLVRARPGLRSPGAVDAFEMTVRAVVGQQVSVSGARTILGRLAAEYGEPVFPQAADDDGWLLFPDPFVVAGIDPADLPMPRARGRAIVAIARAFGGEELVLDAGSDRIEARRQLLAMPGIGPWTADYLMMRILGDPDVFLDSDLGVRHAVASLADGTFDPRDAAPWRSYLTHHLWARLAADTPASATRNPNGRRKS
jgi:AraC family transcriptional regulator of adaptative response / DNA-3-methyladenine glycosylase II